ncbi:MAG: zinc ABC transporter substrate-binding protein [Bacteroidetes bacterium]|nr:zinc ABC transporter substrate-binding protein [Bacteroidota bacterium]
MKKILVLSLPLSLLFASCSSTEQEPVERAGTPITVASVNYPLHFFAQKIGGNLIEATLPVRQDVDPAYWNPEPDEIVVFQNADLILTNGAGYAKWLDKVSLPTAKMVNTSRAFKDAYIDITEGVTHTHGPEGEHEHLGYAFTTWLDFKRALEQAEAVKNALGKLLPGSKNLLDENFSQLKSDLVALDERAAHATAPLTGTTILASHPVYQYFSGGYGLTIVSKHWEPHQMPTENQWLTFRQLAEETSGRLMLWERQPLKEEEDRLTKVGVMVVVFDPCANRPEKGNLLEVMNRNLEALTRSTL